MPDRVYATLTPELSEALEAAPQAHVIEEKTAPQSARLAAWALYGYHRWQEDQEHEAKLAAYQAMAEDDERANLIREANLRAAANGLL